MKNPERTNIYQVFLGFTIAAFFFWMVIKALIHLQALP